MRTSGGALCLLILCLALAGCGLGPGAGNGTVHVRVSEAFGARTLVDVAAGRANGRENDLQALTRHASARTAANPENDPHGGRVTAVDGHTESDGQRWFFFVNGIQADKGPGGLTVHRGDDLWFDLHDASATTSVSAVVGAFPQPFQSGVGGRRYPSTISCGTGMKAACARVSAQFSRLHIPLSGAGPGYGATDVLSVNVGTWHELAGEVVAELLAYGPGSSGVYAHFGDGGRQLDLEDAAGRIVRRLGPDAGLIAAISTTQDPAPTWLVTGTDAAGVRAAARAFTTAALAGHFALAVDGTTQLPVPLPDPGSATG